MTHLVASMKGVPARRAIGRFVGYGLFGWELAGSVVISLAVVANILAIARTGTGAGL